MGRALKIGCGCLVLAVLLCVGTTLVLRSLVGLVLPDPDVVARSDPLSIEGQCRRDEVAAYLADSGPRVERLFAGLSAFSQAPSGSGELSAIDVDALRASRTELAEAEVAECLRALRDEEVALADVVIAQVASLQVGGTPSPLRAGTAMLQLVRGVRVTMGRMTDARRRLEVRYGLTDAAGTPMPVVVPYPAP